jgi:FtsH-binding integral membrane protein
VANTFIWNWLLLPALPLAEVLKQDVSAAIDRQPLPHARKVSAYAFLALVVFALWAVSYPGWRPFIAHVLQAQKPDLVLDLVLILAPCYCAFVLGSLASAVFYALGRTEMLVAVSACCNVVLVVLFVLVLEEIIASTVFVVAAIFGAGLVLGGAVSAAIYLAVMLKRYPLI